jgi:23S rRNA (guanosine2251-2'-O)-methyltransferase
MHDDDKMIFGTRAVIEAIAAGREIDRILVQKGLSNALYHELRKALRGDTVPIQFVPPEKLRKITDRNHQGVIAYVTEVHYHKTETLLPAVFEAGRIPLLLVLDKVTDVRNFGAIARSAACAGVDFIVVPSRGSAQVNADAVKTSAGALHHVKVCREDNLKSTLEYLHESGVQVVACHEKTDKLIYDLDLREPTALLMGGEESGISTEYVKRSQAQAKIPMSGGIASLNVSVAAGIALFEAVRQRLQR